MRVAFVLVVLGLTVGCTPDPSPTLDMVEVRGENSPIQRTEIGATVLKTLADDGLPDLSCTGDATTAPRCENAITPYELLVRVVYDESMSRIYIQCQVRDDSEHPGLLNTCLKRVRAELEK